MWPYIAAALFVVLIAKMASPRSSELGAIQPAHSLGWWLPAGLCALVLSSLSALRWGVGTDYWAYVRNYYGLYRQGLEQNGLTSEPGIRLVTHIAINIHDHYVVFFGAAAALTIVPVVAVLFARSGSPDLSLLLYILSGAWQVSFNAVRQSLAGAIAFVGVSAILKRQTWRYLSLVAVASLFHISAVVLLLLYYVPRRRLKVIEVAILGIGALILFNSYAEVARALTSVGYSAAGGYFEQDVHPARVLVAAVPYALYLFTVRSSAPSTTHFYGNVMLLNALVYLAAANSAYLARFAVYGDLFIALAIPAFLSQIREARLRVMVTVGVVIGYAVYWYVVTASSMALNPYVSIIGNPYV